MTSLSLYCDSVRTSTVPNYMSRNGGDNSKIERNAPEERAAYIESVEADVDKNGIITYQELEDLFIKKCVEKETEEIKPLDTLSFEIGLLGTESIGSRVSLHMLDSNETMERTRLRDFSGGLYVRAYLFDVLGLGITAEGRIMEAEARTEAEARSVAYTSRIFLNDAGLVNISPQLRYPLVRGDTVFREGQHSKIYVVGRIDIPVWESNENEVEYWNGCSGGICFGPPTIVARGKMSTIPSNRYTLGLSFKLALVQKWGMIIDIGYSYQDVNVEIYPELTEYDRAVIDPSKANLTRYIRQLNHSPHHILIGLGINYDVF